jgi:hypothetical protein
MEHDTAGDPITGVKWTHTTTEKISNELARFGIIVSAKTVCRLLKNLGFSLRINNKSIESGNKNPPSPQQRDQQFKYIRSKRESFAQLKCPVISIDSKKRELIGNFRNNGRAWENEATKVKDHDFPSDADGVALIYGIYDIHNNHGDVYVGTSHDTPAFSVTCIADWWKNKAMRRWPGAKQLLILADSGGSNSSRSRVWKYKLYHQLAKMYGVHVTVCHYPPGTSKWNPIEHRLFAEISKNWAGQPLLSYETVLKHLRTTKTKTGLRVSARINRKAFCTGERVADKEMETISIEREDVFPNWNYTIKSS